MRLGHESQANGRLWGARAPDWANIQEGMGQPAYEAVLERTNVGPDTRYLDAGCGSGMAAQLAAARRAQASGIDAAKALLANARSRVPGGDFHHGDIEELPFLDRVFDVVTGFNSFQYAANPLAHCRGSARDQANRHGRCHDPGQSGGYGSRLAHRRIANASTACATGRIRPLRIVGRESSAKFAVDATLTPVAVFDVDCPFEYPDEATAVRGLNSAGVAVRAMEHTSEGR